MYSELFNLISKEYVDIGKNLYNLKMKRYNGGSSVESYIYMSTYLSSFYQNKLSLKELEDNITDCSADGGVDAFNFGIEYIDIFDFKYKNGISSTDLERVKISINKYIINRENNFKGDEAIEENLKKIFLKENKRKKIRLIIVRDKLPYSKEDVLNFSKTKMGNLQIKNIIISIESNNIEVVFKDTESLFFDKIKENSIIGPVLLDIQKDLFGKNQLNSKQIIAKVTIDTLFANFVKPYGLKIISSNIRGHLNKKGFSEKILQTLKAEPEKFHLYHNGITITCNKICPCDPNPTSVTLHNPQIVNGAQSIFGLFNGYENGNLTKKEIKEASIICKIIEADNNFSKKICETSNTQNVVKSEDLRSNDEIQIFLEEYIKAASDNRYFYKRKKDNSSNKKNINSTKLFQWVYAAFLEQPASAKNDKQFLFDIVTNKGKYNSIESNIKSNLSKLIQLCDICFFVENEKKLEKDKYKKSMLKHMDFHIIAGLFYLNSVKNSDFDKIYLCLNNFYNVQIKKDPSLNENKIFTKNNKAWLELKKIL